MFWVKTTPNCIAAFKKEEKGYTQPIKLDGNTVFLAVENMKTKGSNSDDPDTFKHLYCDTYEEAFRGEKGKNFIYLPVKDYSPTNAQGYLKKFPMYAIVQVERTKKGSRSFGIRENQILESLCLMMTS